MYWTYLRRELSGRKKQTAIVAAGLAVAIALVIVVTALSAGIRDAQTSALASVYGVGTDLTVTGATREPGQGGSRTFQFSQGDGQSSGGTTTLSQSRLLPDLMHSTLAASTLDTVRKTAGVTAASAALSLSDTTFSGQMPDAQSGPPSGQADQAQSTQGGSGGSGASRFTVDSFSVLGIDASNASVGPMSAVSVKSGRALTASDHGTDVAVVDANYAKTNSLKVGGTVAVAGTDMKIVGLLASASDSADTASDVYIPLDVAQKLSGVGDVISTIYVRSASSADAATVQAALQKALPKATVSSQSDLAATVSSSLASASSLISHLGLWLSVIVLAAALVLAVLFTISGVARRTREFGTLKAIGWSNGRVVGQVAGESAVQGLIGGVVGLVLGLAAVIAIDVISPTISTAPSVGGSGGGGGAGGGPVGGFSPFGAQAAAAITLHAPVTMWVVAAAVGLAILGGLVAGAFGGWRAARLSPAEALRSVG